ncbi:MAG TPA: ATP-binding cassette domain-containing protein [Candidatus Eisenbacteria bacterium]|nr:ATP-binding cassette domain-containing protein [Candidatus Eisenbacteria bacterium]
MIAVSNLVKRYGETVAVDGVTFTVERGEVLGFLGPNGAGKTTTMRILTTFIPPDEGTATLAGFDVRRQPLDVCRRVGYLPENAPLYMDMGTVDYLLYVAEMRGIPSGDVRSRVAKVVEVCGLGPALAKNIGQLSKGFRQRVGLAQAMIHEPDILILDEPTSGLDPNQIVEIRSLIKEIGREKTVILSTHILPEVSATCGRVIIISNGKLVGSGTPESLASQAVGGVGVTVVLRGNGDDLEGGLRSLNLAEKVEFAGAEAEALRFRVTAREGVDAGGLGEAVSGLAAERGWRLRELRPEGASLEDVFRELTTREDNT